MSGKGAEAERKVRLSQEISGFNLKILQQELGEQKGDKLLEGKGSKGVTRVRLNQDVCGFS